MPTSLHAKRAFDLTLAAPAIVLTAPIQVVVALAVRRRLGRPVLFRQTRPGLNGRPFQMVKFRTMIDPDPARGLITDADRITPFGAALRASSLDELPALWNILRGDMSFVGPRPLLMQYLQRYSLEQARRHEVKPGLTGLAQVSGRNTLGWEERLRMDVYYVDHHSVCGDLQLIWRTVHTVVARKGVNEVNSVSMTEFLGYERLGDIQ